ncbi:MAG: hypothetical protein ACR2NV_11600 [Thermoleophilaceae bacterium]
MACRSSSLTLAAVSALLLSACARQEEVRVPVECKAGRAAVRAALARAPKPVTVEGRPLSSCFTTTSNSADIAEVGEEHLAVASALADKARAQPGGPEATRLGYLIGAVRRGASTTQGTNDEMVRRLEQEVLLVDTSSPAFRRGERAGRTGG